MFLNCSNHGSAEWGEEQLKAALKWGNVVDLPFPNVPSDFDEADAENIISEVAGKIIAMKPDIVMCQGEFTVSYGIIKKLMQHGITVVAACSERCTVEKKSEDGSVQKISEFRFVRFRKYQ